MGLAETLAALEDGHVRIGEAERMGIVGKCLLILWLGILAPQALVSIIVGTRVTARGPDFPFFPWSLFLWVWFLTITAAVACAVMDMRSLRGAFHGLFLVRKPDMPAKSDRWCLLALVVMHVVGIVGMLSLW